MFKKRDKSPKAEHTLASEINDAVDQISDHIASGSTPNPGDNDPQEAGGFNNNPAGGRSRDSSVGRAPSSSYGEYEGSSGSIDDANLTLTSRFPLGRALLAIMTNQLELSKKNRIPLDADFEKICQDVIEHHHTTEQNTNQKIKLLESKLKEDISKIKDAPEQPFRDHTETIFPPVKFSSADTMKNNEYRKRNVHDTFPTTHKFTGPDSRIPISEFLRKMNDAQEECMLSLKEFKSQLKKCTSGKAWEEVTGWIDNKVSLESIYTNLLVKYDQRVKPEAAKLELDAYLPPIDATLNIVQSDVMSLGQRAMLLHAPVAREQAFNHDCIDKLIKVLPEDSKNQALLSYQKLIYKLGRMPTYTEFLSKLAVFQSVINNNYDKERPKRIERQQKKLRRNYEPAPYKRQGKYTARVRELNTTARKPATYTNDRQPGSYQKNRPPSGQQNNRQTSEYQRKNNRPNTRSMGNPNHMPIQNRRNPIMNNKGNSNSNSYNKNRNMNKNQGYGNKTEMAARGRHHCSLCGMSTHSASMGCYKMRSDNGKLVFSPPSQSPCSMCQRQEGKTLYHPAQYCFLRPAYQKLDREGKLTFPTREERDDMTKYINGEQR